MADTSTVCYCTGWVRAHVRGGEKCKHPMERGIVLKGKHYHSTECYEHGCPLRSGESVES